MKRAFSVRFPAVDPEPGFDGMAAVFNQAAVSTGTRVVITDVRAYPCTGMNSDVTNSAGNQGILALERITAASGGTTVTPIKHDTNASTLSGVDLRLFPDSITVSGGTIRRFGDAFSFSITQAINFQAQFRAPGIVDVSDDGKPFEGQNIWRADGIAETEPIVLNNNEGLACIKRSFGVPQAHHWSIVIKSGSNTYRYPVRDAGAPCELGQATWALFNSSGAAISVMIVSMPDLGESNIPRYRLSRISGITSGGTSVTPVKHDTQTNLSALSCMTGPFVCDMGGGGLVINYLNYGGTPVPIAEQQRIGTFRQWLGLVGLVRETTAVFNVAALGRNAADVEIWPGERRGAYDIHEDAIVLNPGEGLAVIGGGNGLIETSEAAFLDIEMTGYVETPGINQPRLGFQLGI